SRQHPADVAVPVPAMAAAVVDRAVLELARQERPPALELAKHVAPERRIRPQELVAPPVALVPLRAAVPADARLDQRQRLGRIDEGVELEELPFLPEQPVELGRVESAEPAPEDEVLGWRDRRDRIELEEPEPAHGVEDAASGAVEELRADGDPARLLRRDRSRQPGQLG